MDQPTPSWKGVAKKVERDAYSDGSGGFGDPMVVHLSPRRCISATVLLALLACGASLFLLMFRSLPFSGSPSGKPGFSFRKPLPTGDSKISKCLKCAPVQAGTLPRGAKVSETHALVHHPRRSPTPPWGSPKSSIFHPAFSKGSSNPLGSLAGPLEGHLESPWCPQGPKWLPKWPKMDTKTCPKRLPERKTQNVSKPYYLL